jgi:hypothetical protein
MERVLLCCVFRMATVAEGRKLVPGDEEDMGPMLLCVVAVLSLVCWAARTPFVINLAYWVPEISSTPLRGWGACSCHKPYHYLPLGV